MLHNNRGASLVHLTTLTHFCVISDFRRKADEDCAVLGYYAASSGKVLRRFGTTSEDGDRHVPKRRLEFYHHSLRNNAEDRSPRIQWK